MSTRVYEEAEGLTKELIQAYLERTGWVPRGDSSEWRLDGEQMWLHDNALDAAINGLARCTGRSHQSILREINPRLLAGCPDLKYRQAHPGLWLAINPEGAGFLVHFDDRGGDPGFVVYESKGNGLNPEDPFYRQGCCYMVSSFQGGLDGWKFWPVDDLGNKVPLEGHLSCACA